MSNDNWGEHARFGIFIVGAESVPEAEWWAMAPPGVSVHAARVTARTPWAMWTDDRNAVTLSDDLARGAAQFASMGLSAVVLAHSSSSIIGGPGWDHAVTRELAARVGSDTAVTTNGTDCVQALKQLGVRNPFLVIPPWFGDTALRAADRYLGHHGLNIAGSLRHVPEARWADVAPQDLYANRMHMAQRTDLLLEQIRDACPGSADGVLIAGTGFRCVGIIDAIESALGRPVVTANQASLWRCLGLTGFDTPIVGYGRLLEDAASPD
ncbi:MAG: hypothetical protein AAFN27_23500 [Pseudomonadota bacterium]